MLHTIMMGHLNRFRDADSRDFTFGSILVVWFLDRVPMLGPRVFLSMFDAREPPLMQWE
jgi:hypothetical protein